MADLENLCTDPGCGIPGDHTHVKPTGCVGTPLICDNEECACVYA